MCENFSVKINFEIYFLGMRKISECVFDDKHEKIENESTAKEQEIKSPANSHWVEI